MERPLVSAVIPSYGRAGRLEACIASLKASEPPLGRPLEIIVSMSGYPAEYVEYVRSLGVKVDGVSKRSLVSAARNRGASVTSGDMILFIDDDNILAPDCVTRLATALIENGHLAVAGPVAYYAQRPSRIWCAGVRRTRLLGWTLLRTRLPSPTPPLLPSEDFPNCFMVRRDDFIHVNGFDQNYFPQHYEEADLAARLREAGRGSAACVTEARVWHQIDLSMTRRLHLNDAVRAYYSSRSRAVFTARHDGRARWWAYVLLGQFLFAAIYLGMGLAGAPVGDRVQLGKAYVRGMYHGLKIGLKDQGRSDPRLSGQRRSL